MHPSPRLQALQAIQQKVKTAMASRLKSRLSPQSVEAPPMADPEAPAADDEEMMRKFRAASGV